jgi:hypothetical protein
MKQKFNNRYAIATVAIVVFFLIFFLFKDEKWEGVVYPDRNNLTKYFYVGKSFKSLEECRDACQRTIYSSNYKEADYSCGMDCKPLYPNIPDSVMLCKRKER